MLVVEGIDRFMPGNRIYSTYCVYFNMYAFRRSRDLQEWRVTFFVIYPWQIKTVFFCIQKRTFSWSFVTDRSRSKGLGRLIDSLVTVCVNGLGVGWHISQLFTNVLSSFSHFVVDDDVQSWWEKERNESLTEHVYLHLVTSVMMTHLYQ